MNRYTSLCYHQEGIAYLKGEKERRLKEQARRNGLCPKYSGSGRTGFFGRKECPYCYAGLFNAKDLGRLRQG